MNYLENVLHNLTQKLGEGTPKVLGALAILLIGYFISKRIGSLITKLLNKSHRLKSIKNQENIGFNIPLGIGNLVYYIIMLINLIIVLSILGVNNALLPLQTMLSQFLLYIPLGIAAFIIGFAGYILAKMVSEFVAFSSGFIDKTGESLGFKDNISIAKVVKQIIFIFIFVPILIVAIDTLKIEALSGPAINMLQTFMDSIPNIIAASLILIMFFIGGKFVVNALTEILKGLGVDSLSSRFGLELVLSDSSLSLLIGRIAFFFLIFGGIITAAEKLEFNQLTTTLTSLLTISGRIFFGLITLVVGNYISNLIFKTLNNSSSLLIARIARFAVLGLFIAISLKSMGIADQIINLAFGLTLGAVAVAFALAFGLGGREAAGIEVQSFFSKLKDKKEE